MEACRPAGVNSSKQEILFQQGGTLSPGICTCALWYMQPSEISKTSGVHKVQAMRNVPALMLLSL